MKTATSTLYVPNYKLALTITCTSFILLIISAVIFKPLQKETLLPPDFSSASNVKEKKQMFFSFFSPLIEAENERILSIREKLQNEGTRDSDWLTELASRYRVNINIPPSEADVQKLLRHIDILPKSLVLSQAAIESAWGTSRFAQEGYNYFGQWCFSEGCGMVPASRSPNANHEVQSFDSPADSVRAYFLNINRLHTYDKLRAMRVDMRKQNLPITGCQLARGLEKYSERGLHYVNEVRQMIRINRLGANKQSCGDLKIASNGERHNKS